VAKLKVEEKIPASSYNIRLFLEADKILRCVHFNEFSGDTDIIYDAETHSLPWDKQSNVSKGFRHWETNDDDSLVEYVEANFNTNVSPDKVMRALRILAYNQSYHPIKDYLAGLEGKWDKKPRISQLLQKYFGAKDTPYVREAMLLTLKAAVARAFNPGTKFDTMLVLIGSQGCGKSTFCRFLAEKALGAGFFSDSLSMSDTRDKTAAEKIIGSWIIELAEADGGITRTDVRYTKQFLSSCDDYFRASYAPRATHHPRQCVFIGTTNSDSFLHDDTGNRRFWPIQCPGVTAADGTPLVFSMDTYEVNQIWAEAVEAYFADQSLVMGVDARKEAEEAQTEALETDEREGKVEEYLNTLLPDGWDSWKTENRLFWLNNPQNRHVPGTVERKRVCRMEIWIECLGNDSYSIPQKDSRTITRILQKLGWRSGGNNDKETFANYGRQECYRRCKPVK